MISMIFNKIKLRFQPESGNTWAEYDNGRKVFSFQLVSQNGQNVILRKTDGSILSFDNNRVTIRQG